MIWRWSVERVGRDRPKRGVGDQRSAKLGTDCGPGTITSHLWAIRDDAGEGDRMRARGERGREKERKRKGVKER